MSLTGPVLEWALWILAVALFSWTIVAWPRSSGPGWLPILRRIGHQLAVVLVVVLAIAVGFNDEYGWYANWGDLANSFASGPPPGDTVTAGAHPAEAAGDSNALPRAHTPVPLAQIATRSVSLGLTKNPGPDGQYHDYNIPGTISGVHDSITVWFPTAYTDPTQAKRRFPVLEAFHGVPGSPHEFSVNFHLGEAITAQVAAGHMVPAIVIAPNIAPDDIDTECVNGGAGKPRMEDWITQDVTNWVDQHLRAASGRGSWATLGFSAGAWCASMLAMLHPQIYGSAISLGGYFQPTFERPYVPFTAESPAWRHYDLVQLAENHPPKMALWVQTSKADPVSYQTTAQLLAAAKPPLSITADILANAGHRAGVWIALIPRTLQWLGAVAPGFRPTARSVKL